MPDDNPLRSTAVDPPHTLLLRLCGSWSGTCRTWFKPGELADESPIQSVIRPLLEGRFVQMDDQGTLLGEAMHGMAIFGYYQERQRFEVSWINNLHMGTGMLYSTGQAVPDGFSVIGHYPDPSGGLDWGWRTELSLVDDDHFTLTAYNIPPGGEPARAIEAEYRRKHG